MERKRRPIIAVNIYNGDVKQFGSEKDAARSLGTTVQAIQSSRMWHSTSGDWRFYDSIENMEKRITRIREDIETVKALGL